MVKIRLKRMGAHKKPFYRVVVADSRTPVEDVRSSVFTTLRLFLDLLIFSTSAATETFLASEDEERSANLTPSPMRIESELLLVLLPYESATFPEWL